MPKPKPPGRRARPERSPRGGPRPGAGAPRGNLNAFKHGRRSRQLAGLAALLASDPTVFQALLRWARRHDARREQGNLIALDLLSRLLQHAHDIAAGIPSPGPFADLHRLNVKHYIPERRTNKNTARNPRTHKPKNPHKQPPSIKPRTKTPNNPTPKQGAEEPETK